MRYGSVCSGIEAASVAWRPLGWECAFVSEIEKFPAAVLAERFPEVPNLGDFTKIARGNYEGDIDLLVGGTPCQAFSIAGLRKGLNDERGNLALEFARLAFRTHARWVVWENVPGVLSSKRGEDFATFLSLLVGWEVTVPNGKWRKAGLVTAAPGCFNVGWRVLDAQYTRVQQFPRAIPQRRRRVILVGSLGSWEDCAKVLFDGEMCGGDAPPRREARQAAPGDAGADLTGSGWRFSWWDGGQRASTLTTRSIGQMMPDKDQLPCVIDTRWHTCATDGSCPSLLATDYKEPKAFVDASPTSDASYPSKMNNQDVGKLVAEECYPIDMMNVDGRGDEFKAKCYGKDGDAAYSLTRRRPSGVCTPGVIRRYIPLEAERLMGFPDGWTQIPWRGKPASECPDGPRYKALGNSMCTNVMMWIGERIHEAEKENSDG